MTRQPPKCSWCSMTKEAGYYPFIVRESAGHTICWLRQAKKTMLEQGSYNEAISKMVWLYTHVINITRTHHGVGSTGTSLMILEVMGKQIHSMWMELVNKFGIPRGTENCDTLPVHHRVQSYTRWMFAERGYSKLLDYNNAGLSEEWNRLVA